jgi:hypothetical protein
MGNINLASCENGSQPKIDLGRSIDGIPEEEKQAFIQQCCKKLSYGGKLTLQGLSLDSFCKSQIFSGPIDIRPILGLKSVTKLQDIMQILEGNGLTVTDVRIENNIYTVEALK